MGVTVQVLKRGTMFAMRASKLYELYRHCTSLDQIPPADRENLEKNFFRMTFDQIWESCRQFFQQRDPHQLERAARDPHHQMALVFRWYLGQSPRWAVAGEPTRKMDYQVWCGPAMGAFNEWVKGTAFEKADQRGVVNVAFNLLFGAGVVLRQQALRAQGVQLPEAALATPPLSTEEIFHALGAQ